MQVISKKRSRDFWREHADAETRLRAWYKIARKAQWLKFADIRAVFPSADKVGDCIVFDICHNKYRLIVIITKNWHKILVRFVLTHKDYDKEKWKKDCGC